MYETVIPQEVDLQVGQAPSMLKTSNLTNKSATRCRSELKLQNEAI